MFIDFNAEFDIVDGPKLLYMNTSIRGYPLGIRVGSDPRNPALTVDLSFDRVNFCNIPYSVVSIEVWGCSSPKSRYDIK